MTGTGTGTFTAALGRHRRLAGLNAIAVADLNVDGYDDPS